ncbi:MAG: hypothetical protein RMK20_04310, partial [Verrucomicrobiales bacterium]|nr:hypothetical protein [Verrucomicrobiales bacterium]
MKPHRAVGFAAVLLVWSAVCALAADAGASNDGAQVVVVYNTALRESREVAEHYAQRRGVPSEQVWGLKLSTSEEITWKEYLETLERPLLQKLESSGLWRFGPAEA